MNQILQKKNFFNNFYLSFENICIFLILAFPLILILGVSILEISSSFISIYGCYIFIKKKYYLNRNIYFYLLVIFYLLINTSSLFSLDKADSFGRSFFLIRIPFFIFAIIIILNHKPWIFKFLLYSIVVCFTFVYLDDLLQFVRGYDIFNFPKVNHRLSGPFKDELIPGSYLFRFGLITIIFFSIKMKIDNIFFYVLLSFLLIVGIIITGEKTTSVMILFLILIFSCFRFGLLKTIPVTFLLVVFFLSIFVALIKSNPIYNERIWSEAKRVLPILNPERSFGDSEYGLMILTSFHIWKDNPLIGVGLKNYRHVCSDIKYNSIESLVISERCSTHPHNFYAELLSETGLLGTSTFVILLIVLFKDLFSSFLNTKNYLNLSFILTLFVIF